MECGSARSAPSRASPGAGRSTVELAVDGLGSVLVCHSTPTSDDPIYTRITPDAELAAIFGRVDADVVVCGHTHMQYDRTLATGCGS